MSLNLPAGRVRFRRGLTLVELLVTLTIGVMLLAIALPVVKMSLDGSRVREASRMVNGFVAMAKARAAASGLPQGFWLERDAINPNACSKIYLTEVAPPFTGDFVGTRICLKSTKSMANPNGIDLSGGTSGIPAYGIYELCDPKHIADPMNYPAPLPHAGSMPTAYGNGNDSLLATTYPIVKDYERFEIQFDLKGPLFPGFRAGTRLYLYLEVNTASASADLYRRAQPLVPNTGSTYRIIRVPRRSDTTVLELPRGTAIDLSYSGDAVLNSMNVFQGTTFAATPPTMSTPTPTQYPPVIMFQPSGQMERVYYSNSPQFVAGTIHLLVGRVEKVQPPTSTTAPLNPYDFTNAAIPAKDLRTTFNLYDPENLWISLGHRTGSLTTAENSPLDAATGLPGTPAATAPMAFDAARRIAVTHQAIGGK